MVLDPWLPVGFRLPSGAVVASGIFGGDAWQIIDLQRGGRSLVTKSPLLARWVEAGLVDAALFAGFEFAGETLSVLECQVDYLLTPVAEAVEPQNVGEAMSFAASLRRSRQLLQSVSLHDAIFVDSLSVLLPTYSMSAPVDDAIVLGSWLSGGAQVSAQAERRIRTLVGWLQPDQLEAVVSAAGFALQRESKQPEDSRPERVPAAKGDFRLAGRPELEAFLREHVIDIIENQERYKLLGIDFPSAIILHGPPGCGKTFAVERLVEHLGWPSFQIDSASVGSPYIHETSRKIAEVFDRAMENAPAVLVIDEMEAFLMDRQMGAGASTHRVEEVAEFLRRIPEAIKHQVLIVAMTNRLEMIDSAIIRRGRFDHIIKVDMASQSEIFQLLELLIEKLPHDDGLALEALAEALTGRPLADVAFVVREAARLAVRTRKERIDGDCLQAALETTPARGEAAEKKNRIGFV